MFLEMDYEKITVKALYEKAMINRRTFYLPVVACFLRN